MSEDKTEILSQAPVVLLFADDMENSKLKEQIKLVKSLNHELENPPTSFIILSDMVYDLNGDPYPNLTAAKLRSDFEVRPAEFLMIVLSRQGEVIQKEAFVEGPESLKARLNSVQE